MSDKRIVITGIGVISSLGTGKDEFWNGLKEGRSGVRRVSLFDTTPYSCKKAAESTEFDPVVFLGSKGIRTLDRSATMLCSAAKLAIDDSRFRITDENTNDTGVVAATTLGSLYSVSEFDKKALREGPRAVNPALFSNTVISSAASQVSIKFKIRGFNSTIASGFCASLDAVNYAADFLRLGRASTVFVGAVESLSLQLFLGLYKLKFLAGSDGESIELSCPFDSRRNGVISGEAAAFVVLETLESALSRKANIYAEVAGYGTSFDPYRINKYNPRGTGLKAALKFSLVDAGLKPEGINHIASSANSTPDGDLIETEAIKYVFQTHAKKIPISAVKSMTGECISASGLLQILSSLFSFNTGIIAPTINYSKKDPSCDLDYVVNTAREAKVNNSLVINFGPSGCNSALILKKFKK